MTTKEQILIDINYIEMASEGFLNTIQSNPFYNKNIFFTQGIRANKYTMFQILGNLGGLVSDNEYNTETDYYIISDQLIGELSLNNKNEQLIQLEKSINSKGKKYINLKIISENTLLTFVKKRCTEINDQVTLNLINQIL